MASHRLNIFSPVSAVNFNNIWRQSAGTSARSVHTQVPVLVNSDVLTAVHKHGNLEFGVPPGRAGNNSPERRRNLMIRAVSRDREVLPVVAARDFEIAKMVHSAGFVDFLQTAFQRWKDELHEDASYLVPGADDMAERGLVPFHTVKSSEPRSRGLSAEFACYASDFETPIYESTAPVLLQDLGIVNAAVDHIKKGSNAVYALTTHAGHHAGPSYYSGFCYQNTASIACELLRLANKHPALLDVDFHGGNGSFDLAQKTGMWFRSINRADAYPWVDMGDSGIELPGHTSWSSGYADALEAALSALPSKADVLVVSLGFDTLSSDPESWKRASGGLSLEVADFRSMGASLTKRGIPVLVMQEGGYDLNAIPDAFLEFLRGLAEP